MYTAAKTKTLHFFKIRYLIPQFWNKKSKTQNLQNSKSEHFEIWGIWFYVISWCKNPKTQGKGNWSEHTQIIFLFLEFLGFWVFITCKSSNPQIPKSIKLWKFELFRFYEFVWGCHCENLKCCWFDDKIWDFSVWPLYIPIYVYIRDFPKFGTFVSSIKFNWT